MGGLREGYKDPYSWSANYIISIALRDDDTRFYLFPM
jgi:hypothetical protein